MVIISVLVHLNNTSLHQIFVGITGTQILWFLLKFSKWIILKDLIARLFRNRCYPSLEWDYVSDVKYCCGQDGNNHNSGSLPKFC